MKAALAQAPGDVETLLADAAVAPPASALMREREAIDRLFASDRYEDILAALEADGSGFAQATLGTLATKSPQTVKVALRELAESLRLADFADEMQMEYRIAARVCQRPDFIEGVRALIVDKTNDPRWDPPTPQAVEDALLDAIFAPLKEEWTPFPKRNGARHG
jgi:enoyl-CoA hydratase